MYKNWLGRYLSSKSCTTALMRRQSERFGRQMVHPRSKKNIKKFIDIHKINTDEIKLSIEEFQNFNEFFTRELKPGCRPIDSPDRADLACMPADCRILVFDRVSESRKIWVKGCPFTLNELFGTRKDLVETMHDGAVAICRLAPQDYHRWHAPISGKQKHHQIVPGLLYSVNPIAIENLDVFSVNQREVIELESEEFGKVILIAVGAAMVGSIVTLKRDDGDVVKGEQHGYFQFGGSTLLLIFEQGRISFDADLCQASSMGIETLVRVGDRLGRAMTKSLDAGEDEFTVIKPTLITAGFPEELEVEL
jgi:phosphatidylserine decarboxylase